MIALIEVIKMKKLAKQAFTILVMALLFVPIVIAADTVAPDFDGTIPEQILDEDTSTAVDAKLKLDTYFIAGDNLQYTLLKEDGSALTNSEITMSAPDADSKVSFTPKLNWNGALDVKINAKNSLGEAVSNVFTITVNQINDEPTLSLTDKEAYEGELFEYPLVAKAVDVDMDADLNNPVTEILTYELTDKDRPDSLAVGADGKITITPASSDVGIHAVKMKVTDSAAKTSEAPFELTIHPDIWHKTSQTGDLKLTYDITDENDIDSLKIGDEIEVEVTVKNDNSNDDISNVQATIALWDLTEGFEVAVEDSSDYDLEKRQSGDDDEFTETIKMEIPDGVEDDRVYALYIYAYEAGNEDSQYSRASDWKQVDVDISAHEVLLKNLILPTDDVNAGDVITISAEVSNIGKNKEEQIKLVAEDLDTGEKEILEFESLSSGRTATKTMMLNIPESSYSGSHNIKVTAYYDYDDNDDGYDEVSAPVSGFITVVGKGDAEGLTLDKSSINTGETKEVTLTIKNNQGVSKKYTVEVDGTSGWADYVVSPSVSDRNIIAGGSFESKLTITPKTDAAPGEYKVTVSVKSGDFEVDTEELTVAVGASGGLITGGATGLPPYKSWESLGDEMLISATIIGVCIVLAGLGYGYFKSKSYGNGKNSGQ